MTKEMSGYMYDSDWRGGGQGVPQKHLGANR